MNKLTPEQMEVFVGAAQMGVAMGLMHPFEWLVNADRVIDHTDWSTARQRSSALWAAFLAFFQGTDSYPEDPVQRWTQSDLVNAINAYYYPSNLPPTTLPNPSEGIKTGKPGA